MKGTKFKLRPAPLVMVIVLLFQTFYPTAALALTYSASQPETSSFEPVGTTQLVDPFTGDFNYNIGLLTVPGPNGGYPVNISYHAGISPDMEASWTGLGWNVNAGAINRNMRGLPDDFFGSDIVKKEMNIKPNWIFGLSVGVNAELLGFENLSNIGLGAGLSYNNYKGLNLKAEIQSLSDYKIDLLKSDKQLNIGFDVNFDAQDGPDLKINPTLKSKEGEGTDEGDHDGAEKKKFQRIRNFMKGYKSALKSYNELAQNGLQIDFANPSFVPNTSFPEGGFDVSLWAKFGGSVFGAYPNSSVKAFLFFQKLKDKTLDFPSYGYLYSGERNRLDDGLSPYLNYSGASAVSAQVREGMALMDFNRDDHGVSATTPNLPVPMHTFDVYSAGAQGLGMIFRPHRTDVGLLYDARSSSDFTDIEFGMEFGAGSLAHLGLNPGITYTSKYSGKWKRQYKDFEDKFEYTNTVYGINDVNSDDNSSVFRDPFYFRSSGDKVVAMDGTKYGGNDDAMSFEIASLMDLASTSVLSDFDPANYSLNVFPKIKNQPKGTSTTQVLRYNKNTYDQPTTNAVQYKNRFELTNTVPGYALTKVSHLYNANEFPFITSGATGQPLTYNLSAEKKGHHVGEFSVVNPDGNKYVFGLPVYNLKEREVIFATSNNQGNDRIVNYASTDASLNNTKGVDNYYSSTEVPGYATSYLLTAIYSPDYVDVTGNGPSDDDFGYFVKFNYSNIGSSSNPYRWRVPVSGAIRFENYADNDADDKAMYKYGEKEMYYLNSIETKTHFAIFELNDPASNPRLDARGVSTENAYTANNPPLGTSVLPRFLERIKLFSKASTSVPIKTVHFEYDYSLCPNTINSVSDPVKNPTKGKLTLKKLYFTYLNNNTGALSPYEFNYTAFNPSYNQLLSDRWGNYKEDSSVPGSTANYLVGDFPYVDQNKQKADLFASAWNLERIKLPSGGIIKVAYESDDYNYVQNKRAMQMCEITGTGYVDGSGGIHSSGSSLGENQNSVNQKCDLIFFNLKEGLNDQTKLNKYVEEFVDPAKNANYLYFNANMRLKNQPATGQSAYDYVDGYCRMDKGYGIHFDPSSAYTVGSTTYYSRACIKVIFQKATTINVAGNGSVHPFRKAAFEYMKLRRPELFFPLNNTSSSANLGTQFVSAIVNMIQNVGQLLTSYNRYCILMGYGNRLADGTDGNSTSDERKSYLRLLVPDGKKYGGGHRVKRISIDNQWNVSDVNAVREYGQEFYYNLPDGTSSGVAENEPSSGKEESALIVPIDDYKTDRTFVSRLGGLYQDKPVCEGYFPGPGVGYSRVMVKSLTRENAGTEINKQSAGGLTVNEFYTAKDFPVIEEAAETDKTDFDKGLTIPFIGRLKFTTAGLSQGFKVVLNDMHGKPKAVRVYPHNTDFTSSNAQATHEIEYKYSINGNTLENKVTGLFADGDYRNMEMGVERDFVMDMNQDSQFTIDAGLATNTDVIYVPPFLVIPAFSIIPILNYSNNTYRTFVNVKAIYKQGILLETTVRNDKAETKTTNLMFDAYSGKPLLTTVTNEFKKPVYHYDIPSHWHYKEMGAKSQYYKNTSSFSYVSAGNINVSHPQFFKPGDKVRLSVASSLVSTNYREYWITGFTPPSTFQLRDERGSAYSNSPVNYNLMTIVDPVAKNLMHVSAGEIISLSNPVMDVKSPFFIAFNAYLNGYPQNPPPTGTFQYTDCMDGRTMNVSYVYQTTPNAIDFDITPKGTSQSCKSRLVLPSVITISNYSLYDYRHTGSSNIYLQLKTPPPYPLSVPSATLQSSEGCITACLDGVLHAEASRFKNDWSYDYADMGNPAVYNVSGNDVLLASVVNTNPYRFGKTGIWRFHEKYIYQTDRKQSTPNTDIAVDGTYNVFNPHNWGISAVSGANKYWTLKETSTGYSPYGFETERKDWLDLYNSTLYGNNATVAIAVGKYCPYDQLSAQSFENATSVGTSIKGGHLTLQYSSAGTINVNTTDAHTGYRSLNFGNQELQIANLQFNAAASITGGNYHIIPNKKYVLSAWIKNTSNALLPTVTFPANCTGTTEFGKDVVDGWRKLDLVFSFNTVPAPNSLHAIKLNGAGIAALSIDDIRIQPFNSEVKTFVYNPTNLYLMADLNDKNFATYYNYNEAGNLVQVKRETDKGIITIKTLQENLKRQ
ncbi:MAG: hypothetical protein QM534_00515 [Sediminibacterium sp.]|nr:hypothetical protein [Sediminibacterium sp.]